MTPRTMKRRPKRILKRPVWKLPTLNVLKVLNTLYNVHFNKNSYVRINVSSGWGVHSLTITALINIERMIDLFRY